MWGPLRKFILLQRNVNMAIPFNYMVIYHPDLLGKTICEQLSIIHSSIPHISNCSITFDLLVYEK